MSPLANALSPEQEGNPYVRQEAAHALVAFGPSASAAIPALRRALNDPRGELVAIHAREALKAIEAVAKPIRP